MLLRRTALACSLSALALALAACVQEPAMPPDTTAEDTAAINTLRETWASTYESGDAAALAILYTANATVMQPGVSTLSGRAAIQEYYAGLFAMGTVETDLMQTSLTVHGDVAHGTGTFSGTMTPADGSAPQTTSGRYLVAITRDADGAWRLSSAMTNTDDPAMMQSMAEAAMAQAGGGGGN